MQNISIRHGLLATLAIFALMLILGAALGVLELRESSASAERVHVVASRALLLNDAYKDMTRARAALTRAYSAAKEGGSVNADAIASAQKSMGKSKEELEAFAQAPLPAGQDGAMREDILAAGQAHMAAVQQALEALRNNDPTAYAALNDKDVTSSGARYSQGVERFQQMAARQNDDELARGRSRYNRVIVLVAIGLTMSGLLIVAVHLALRRLVVAPLTEASHLIMRVAEGDLTMPVPQGAAMKSGRSSTRWRACRKA